MGKDVRKIQINADDVDLNNQLDNFMQMECASQADDVDLNNQLDNFMQMECASQVFLTRSH